ncbi:MAG: hypothetical protein ACI92G_002140 [Candidatus Pelagisphaera sp.]|jgi:hypothetical protein
MNTNTFLSDSVLLSKLTENQQKIRLQIIERNELFPDNAPGYPWSQVTNALSYVFDLPSRELTRIRLHVDPFMGVETATYYLSDAFQDPVTHAEVTGYNFLGEGVPSEFWAEDPPTPGPNELRFGPTLDGRDINSIAAKNQQYVCNLWRLGMVDIDQSPGRTVFLEIGPGYGGFALNALKQLKNCTYVIVDLPETLIFSASYLISNRPDLKAYVYCPGDDIKEFIRDFESYDLIFIPDYMYDSLDELPYINIGFNTISFPEMPTPIVRGYLDLIAPRLKNFFMSCNYTGKKGRECSVDRVLEEYFSLAPTPEQYMNGAEVSEEEYNDHLFRPTLIGTTSETSRGEFGNCTLRDYNVSTGYVSILISPLDVVVKRRAY